MPGAAPAMLQGDPRGSPDMRQGLMQGNTGETAAVPGAGGAGARVLGAGVSHRAGESRGCRGTVLELM